MLTIYTFIMTKDQHFWATYPPLFVNVLCERPLIENLPFVREAFTNYGGKFLSFFYRLRGHFLPFIITQGQYFRATYLPTSSCQRSLGTPP